MGADTWAEILERFGSGRRCYAAWVAGQLAAYGWVSFDQEFIGELSLRLSLVPGEAYIWDCATLPAFRRRGLYSALLVHILGELRAEPLCRVWIGADAENVPSQRGMARAGFRPVADLVMSGASASRLMWVQGRPGVPPGLVAEARRAFLENRDQAWLAAWLSAKQS
jgi:GNAT superfamily N-acetyltransferase